MWGWLLLHYEGKEDYIRTLKGVLSVCAVLLEHYKLLFLRVPLDVSPSVLFSEGRWRQTAPTAAILPVTKSTQIQIYQELDKQAAIHFCRGSTAITEEINVNANKTNTHCIKQRFVQVTIIVDVKWWPNISVLLIIIKMFNQNIYIKKKKTFQKSGFSKCYFKEISICI